MNSIDNLKAVISKKGGLAMQNRFQIFFTPPTANSVRSLLNQDIGSLLVVDHQRILYQIQEISQYYAKLLAFLVGKLVL